MNVYSVIDAPHVPNGRTLVGVDPETMAKKRNPPTTAKKTDDSDVLAPGIAALGDGDYPAARSIFGTIASDPSLPSGQREMAQEYRSATLLDRAAVLTGLGCVLLFFLVAVFAFVKQP